VSYVGLRLRSVNHAVCTCTYYACVLISKHSVHKLTMYLRGWNSMKRAEQVKIRSQTVLNSRTSESTERPDLVCQ
jgi:hypothetical protein